MMIAAGAVTRTVATTAATQSWRWRRTPGAQKSIAMIRRPLREWVDDRADEGDLHRDEVGQGVEVDRVVVDLRAEADQHDAQDMDQQEEDRPDPGRAVQRPGVLADVAVVDRHAAPAGDCGRCRRSGR